MPSLPYRAYCRTYQTALRGASYIMAWRKPKILSSFAELSEALRSTGATAALLVTDQGLVRIGLADQVSAAIEAADLRAVRYEEVVPNPTVENVEAALAAYRDGGCTVIVALGGGSPMDCAKAVAARVARPGKSVAQLQGLIKVRKAVPPFFAIPTTAGTGSEASVAAVISNPEKQTKYAISDPVLIPHFALLEPELTAGLPPAVTAATGLDALSHAVEAYVGRANTRATRREALEAVGLIFANLPDAVADGSNLTARANMQRAAYLAGLAFTRGYVGNVHAMSHQLSARLGTVHGVGNAVLMPPILEFYLPRSEARLVELGRAAGLEAAGPALTGRDFIAACAGLAAKVGVSSTIDGLTEAEIPKLIPPALHEANPTYPVPVIFGAAEMETIYRRVIPPATVD